MRAALMTAVRNPLDVAQVPDPVATEGAVVLRVIACGVCRSDWHVWSGADPAPLPLVLGHEFCGEVVSVGAGVTRWQVGDKVIAPFILACGTCSTCQSGAQTICDAQVLPGFNAPGAYAEYVAVPFADTNLSALPEGLDPAVAAAMGCRITTAWSALTGRAQLRPGEWLAVFGCGGVGLSAVMLGKALGARVIAVDVVPEKLDHALANGADYTVNARREDPSEAIKDYTQGGAQVVVEALGIPETTSAAMTSLAKLGRMVQIGMPTGEHAQQTLPWSALYSGQLAIFGSRGMEGRRYPALFSFLSASGLDLAPLIARRISLKDVTAELAAFDAPAPPGVAVITEFSVSA
jgi:D-arabinose 1-dehydrogenase-like Zn-dependent alcohol dehydrogenase